MLKSSTPNPQTSFFFTLGESLDQRHPLYILAGKIDWPMFEREFHPLYCHDNGRPAKPIRLMVGLLMLKHIRNISDESVVEQWAENLYYQYFCGEQQFVPGPPCQASDLVHFRHRIGERGCELILRESIRINGDDSDQGDLVADTTVQEKNITFPTDNKLHRKIIRKCKQIAENEDLELRQSYTRTLKQLGVEQRFRNHPKNKKKARKADRKVKTIAGRLARELERKLPQDSPHREQLKLFMLVLAQKRGDKHKVYSFHEPDVECISKGKEHKKYEFGNKVSILYTLDTGVIVGALDFRNPYDGHTLEPALEQRRRLLDSPVRTVTADRGYRGVGMIGNVRIQTPKPFNKNKMSEYECRKRRRMHSRRAAIEPVIGYLKSDHRMGRNFYKGITGDNINVMLSAAAYNFKRIINKWKDICLGFLHRILSLQLADFLRIKLNLMRSTAY